MARLSVRSALVSERKSGRGAPFGAGAAGAAALRGGRFAAAVPVMNVSRIRAHASRPGMEYTPVPEV